MSPTCELLTHQTLSGKPKIHPMAGRKASCAGHVEELQNGYQLCSLQRKLDWLTFSASSSDMEFNLQV
jgi:hypothetical protein